MQAMRRHATASMLMLQQTYICVHVCVHVRMRVCYFGPDKWMSSENV